MATLDHLAVLKRARELAEQDGFVWKLRFQPVITGTKSEPLRLVSE
jgi:hypothetical protein